MYRHAIEIMNQCVAECLCLYESFVAHTIEW